MSAPSDKAVRRVLLPLVCLPLALLVIVTALFVWAAVTREGYEFKELAANYPLAKMRVVQRAGTTKEIYSTLASGVRLDQAMNLSLFDGFDPRMTAEAARKRLGPPTGEWDDPFCGERIPYYDRPQGRVSLCRYETEPGFHRWDTVGYPRQCDQDYLFRDPRVPAQVVPWLPATEAVDVHVQRQVGWGGVTIQMSRTGCAWVVLSERD